MKRHGGRAAAWTGLMVVLAAPPLAGQVPAWPGDPVELAGQVRDRSDDPAFRHEASWALRGQAGERSETGMNVLADSLVALAVDAALRGEEGSEELVDWVVGVLSGAAHGPVVIVEGGTERGVPYSGAPERLLRLAYELPPGMTTARHPLGFGASLISQLRFFLHREEWLRHMQFFAGADHRSAGLAVRILDRAGPEGWAVLREVYLAGARNDSARRLLEELAPARGWR